MAKNTLTLTIDDGVYGKLLAEAIDQSLSIERHINEILARRVGRPHWSDVAENQALAAELERVTGERDRARDTAARFEDVAARFEHTAALLRAGIEAGVLSGDVVASRRFLARYGLAPASEERAK